MITPEEVVECLENRCKAAEEANTPEVILLRAELRVLLDELENRRTETIGLSILT